MVGTSARLLALLSLLGLRREWTGAELAARLDVAPRTIRRDVEKLRSLGYPVEAAPGVAGGYRLGAGGELPPLLLDDAEAVAVAVGLRTAAAGSISGIEETSVQALAKLEQVLPARLRRQVSALSGAMTAFGVDGPRIDSELLSTLAGACRDSVCLRFTYGTWDDRTSRRHVEPHSVVMSGTRWYLLAFDRDRQDWRTFRLDRIQGRPAIGERARRRVVPGGDSAAYVRERLRAMHEGDAETPPGEVRLALGAEAARRRIPDRYAEVHPDGEAACRVVTRGAWTREFVIRMAMLEAEMEIVGPPEMVEATRGLVARLSAGLPA